MEQTKKTSEARRKNRTCVKFTEKEYWRIKKDSLLRGMSIQALLREAYRKGPRCVPRMGVEDSRAMLAELRSVGDEINTIARALNSGVREGLDEDWNRISERLSALRRFTEGFCREQS